jgi:hypothetical protein
MNADSTQINADIYLNTNELLIRQINNEYNINMKLYLDNSFLNRPFDNSDIPENKIEAEILFQILKLVKEGKIILVNSAMIEYEKHS